MFVRILTLRFDDALGAFDDTPVQDLLKDKEGVAMREHVFIKNAAPCLTTVSAPTPWPCGGCSATPTATRTGVGMH